MKDIENVTTLQFIVHSLVLIGVPAIFAYYFLKNESNSKSNFNLDIKKEISILISALLFSLPMTFLVKILRDSSYSFIHLYGLVSLIVWVSMLILLKIKEKRDKK